MEVRSRLRDDGAMSGPPPSDRDAALPPDPWAEQARRRDDLTRRRRRLGWWVAGAGGIVLVVILAIVLVPRLIGGDSADGPITPDPAPTSRAQPSASDPQGTSVDARGADLAELDEVWLIDRGDGIYEWGLTMRSTAAVDRGPFRIDASLRDDERVEVGRVSDSVAELPAGGAASVGGVVDDLAGEPTRLVVDVEVGPPLSEPALPADTLDIVAVTREEVAGASGERSEVITGRVRSTAAADVLDVRLALLWRDESGQVVAAVFHPVDRVRPGIDARFEIPIGEFAGAEGLPTDVSWSR
jgi:hypothetical protein